MSISIFDATVPTYQQMTAAMRDILLKAQEWALENGVSEADLLSTKLAEDMFDFAYQVKSVAHHSWGAVEGIRAGNFSPNMDAPPTDFAGLISKLDDALVRLNTVEKAEIDGMADNAMQFSMGKFKLPFTAANFLLTFSLPNFYFHVTTAYAILRMRGVPIGKMDYIGQMRVSDPA